MHSQPFPSISSPRRTLKTLTLVLLTMWLSHTTFVATTSGQEATAQKEAAMQILLKAVADPDPNTKMMAQRAIKSEAIDYELLAPLIEAMLASEDPVLRSAAAQVFGYQQANWPVEKSIALLGRLLSHANKDVVGSTLDLIGQEHAIELAEQIKELIDASSNDSPMRYAAILALARNAATIEIAVPYLESDFKNWDDALQQSTMQYLELLDRSAMPAIDFVASQSDSASPRIRWYCARIAMNLLGIQDSRSTRSSRRGSSTSRETLGDPDARIMRYVDGLFSKYDTDSDGVIDKAEMENVAGSLKLRFEKVETTKATWNRNDVKELLFRR